MSANRLNDANAVKRARELANRTLAGELDLLIACRKIADLRISLASVPESVMDIFIAVASEVDDLPIGSDRESWAPAVLKSKDVEAADYRARVKDVVLAAMKELVDALKHPGS